jgi:hypothetical protein
MAIDESEPAQQRQAQVAAVFNSRPAQVGSVSRSGRVFNVAGEHIGTVGLDGRVFSPHGTILGWVSASGQIADFRGLVLTRLRPDFAVLDRSGHYIGRVARMVSPQQAAGAALLLLPVEHIVE